ncbi:probable fucosyltransferase 8 [Rhododendron vialii]|uniref:probable fucosyltransferase 8 n=1 Tax=Rhododendron vialii TaxID=182163 RepID=UPI00265DA99D|nr:probable fucosyltransferase 8 [Rhododendron vialii]
MAIQIKIRELELEFRWFASNELEQVLFTVSLIYRSQPNNHTKGPTESRDFQAIAGKVDPLEPAGNNKWNLSFHLSFHLGDRVPNTTPVDMSKFGCSNSYLLNFGITHRTEVQFRKEKSQVTIFAEAIGSVGPMSCSINVRVQPSLDSYAHTSYKPEDKLLGGLLSPGFNEASCLSRYRSIQYRKLSPHKPSPYLISKLRNYESLHKQCGPHTESYNATVNHLRHHHPHHDISNNSTCKYIVHLFYGHSGFGNRMLSLVSNFLFAVLTNRLLLVDQGDHTALLCEPFPDTTWALPFDFPLRDQFDRFDPNHSHCYGNMMRNKTVELSMDDSPPPFVYLNLVHDFNKYDQRFFCDRDQNIMKKVPWLLSRSTQYYIPSLFLMPSFEKELTKLFPEKETVFHHLGRYLVHPSNEVWGLITRYYETYLAKFDERIGIQIRDFSSTGLPFQNSKELASLETIFMDRILDCSVQENLLPKVITNTLNSSAINATRNTKAKSVLVTSLISSYFEKLRNMYQDNPTITGESVTVFQPSHEESQQSYNAQHNMKALAEIYLLSLMDELVTSPWSTFGYVAQGLGGLRPWILSNPLREMDSDSPCRRVTSMEPCFHYPPSYDCEAKIEIDTGARVQYVRHCEDMSRGIKLFDDHEL